MGLDDPGLWEQVELGRGKPIKVGEEMADAALGFSALESGSDFWSGRSREEQVRALVDADGKVMARHTLRTWRRTQWFGPSQENRRFTLEVQLSDPQAVTDPQAMAQLDEELVEMAKAMALGQTPRTRPPQSWTDVEPVLLERLNDWRRDKGLPAASRLAGGTAELLTVAELLLESLPVDGGEEMDHVAWGELNLAEALRKVTRRLPLDADATFRWHSDELREDKGFSFAFDRLPMLQVGEDSYRFGGALTNLGDGRVRIELTGERYQGATRD